MKRILYLGIIALLASCSSSKYAANFQKSGPDFGYGELVTPATPVGTTPATVAQPSNLVASTSKDGAIITNATATVTAEQAAAIAQLQSNYQSLNKSKKKEFRKEVKEQIKKWVKLKNKTGVESTSAVKKTQVWDHDLKLAAIFGVIGVVALLFSGNAFYIIGAISLIIAAVFFVMWISRQ